MQKIETIDLWTEQHKNHYEVFNGAFVDGFESGVLPYDSYKVVRNCNCLISNNNNFPIGNKHHAIIFYKNLKVIRLLVICKETNIDELLENALNQKLKDNSLYQIFNQNKILNLEIDLKEKPILNEFNSKDEIDTGSCDRFTLLKSMLCGNYTEDDTKFGHYDSNKYFYIQNLVVNYYLKTNNEIFEIAHECGFLNDLKTRIIILQRKFSGN